MPTCTSRPVRALFAATLVTLVVCGSATLVNPSVVRSYDGSGNNVANPSWGSAGSDLLRIAPVAYADGASEPSGGNRPSGRDISNRICAEAGGGGFPVSRRDLSAMSVVWGQFLDHDLSLTHTQLGDGAESLPIAVPTGDPWFDPSGSGTATIPLSRSEFRAASR